MIHMIHRALIRENMNRRHLSESRALDNQRVLLLAPLLSTAVPPQFTAVPPFSQIQYGFVR